MTTDFELFKRALKRTYDSLKGQADCEAKDDASFGNRLNIVMAFDQTQIPDFVRQLDKIIKQFPIQGTELKIVNE